MNKFTIPAMLLGVVMIAGVFALMPVYDASTVHTSAAGAGIRFLQLTDICTVPATPAATDCDNITIDIPAGATYRLVSLSVTSVFAAAETLDYAACTQNGVTSTIDVGANTGGSGATVTVLDGTTAAGDLTSIGVYGVDITCTDGDAASTIFTTGDTIVTTMIIEINGEAAGATVLDNT